LAPWSRECWKQDPFSGHLFVFRGKRADLIKVLFWDGTGLCLFTKRLEYGRFAGPATSGHGVSVAVTVAQLWMLLEGLDWRQPEQVWRPAVAG
jgi:transposase